MRTRILVMLVTSIPFGSLPVAALAESCGDYPLTQEQSDYLQAQQLDIAIPEGNVPFIQRCDVDGNGIIDNRDLFLIREHRGQPAAHPDDPMDWDGNGVIHGRDVGGCASSCTSNGCAVKDDDTEEEEGLQAGQQTNGPGDSGACFQTADFDGDGEEDFAGIYEHTGEAQAGGYNLKLVILNKDENGSIQHTTVKYAGEAVVEGGQSSMKLHVSDQPAGEVDLAPGKITLENPGIVAYGHGKPEVIYYWVDGELRRGFYHIDD